MAIPIETHNQKYMPDTDLVEKVDAKVKGIKEQHLRAFNVISNIVKFFRWQKRWVVVGDRLSLTQN